HDAPVRPPGGDPLAVARPGRTPAGGGVVPAAGARPAGPPAAVESPSLGRSLRRRRADRDAPPAGGPQESPLHVFSRGVSAGDAAFFLGDVRMDVAADAAPDRPGLRRAHRRGAGGARAGVAPRGGGADPRDAVGRGGGADRTG